MSSNTQLLSKYLEITRASTGMNTLMVFLNDIFVVDKSVKQNDVFKNYENYYDFSSDDGNLEVEFKNLVDGLTAKDSVALPHVQQSIIKSKQQDRLRNIFLKLMYAGIKATPELKGDIEKAFNDFSDKLYNYLFVDFGNYNFLAPEGSMEKTFLKVKDMDAIKDEYKDFLKNKEISKFFYEDLTALIENEYLLASDIYKRMYALNMLLNFYILQFYIRKIGKSKFMIFTSNSEEKAFKQTSKDNYRYLRETATGFVNKFFKNNIEEYIGELLDIKNITKDSFNDNDCLKKIFDLKIGYKKLEDFKTTIADAMGDRTYDKAELTDLIIRLNKKRNSITDTFTTIVSTAGRGCECVYPLSNTNVKYFAFSSSMIDILARLNLNGEGGFDSVNNFLTKLENKYRIILRDGKCYRDYRNTIRNKISDIAENESNSNLKAFEKMLDNSNMLIRVSDGTNLIVLPEKINEVTIL